MSNETKIQDVIDDVRGQLLGETLQIMKGSYYSPKMAEQRACTVCATGALFIGTFGLQRIQDLNSWHEKDYDGNQAMAEAMRKELSEVFSLPTIYLIEVAFEGYVPGTLRDDPTFIAWREGQLNPEKEATLERARCFSRNEAMKLTYTRDQLLGRILDNLEQNNGVFIP